MAFVVANAAKAAFNNAKNKASGIGKTLKNRASDLANKARSKFSRKQNGPEVPITTPETKSHTLAAAEGFADAMERIPEPSDTSSSTSQTEASVATEPSASPSATSGASGGNSIPVEGMVGDMYPRLKECLCESLARMFTDASPKLIDVAIQTVENKINTDPQIRQYIETHVKSISDSILREQETKDIIIASLTDNCKRPTNAVAGGGRKTRRLHPRLRIGQKPKRYTRFVYKNT